MIRANQGSDRNQSTQEPSPGVLDEAVLDRLTAAVVAQSAGSPLPFPGMTGAPEPEVPSMPAGLPAMESAVPAPTFYFLEPASAASRTSQGPTAQPNSASAYPWQLESLHAQTPISPPTPAPYDVASIRREFPILDERVHGKPLIWLDNAATTQKPRSVIDRISWYYQHENSNIHRGAHTLAARATDAYEAARSTVRRFLNAPSERDIIFVRGATEAINLVAQSWGRRNIKEGDEIVLTTLEHHSNIVPWQRLAADSGARLRVAPVDDRGQVVLEEYEKLLNHRTRLVSMTHVSNALGTITPVREMVAMAHRLGALVLVDGAQAVSHMPVDVQQLQADFYAFSGHKVFGPTGIGVLYARSEVMDVAPPWQGGGNMIADVTFERTLYRGSPARFEAGTGNIADAVGLGEALQFLMRIGLENVSRHEQELLHYATDLLHSIDGLTLIGTAPEKAGVLSLLLNGYQPEDVAAALDQEGIAVRAGHHCAQPALRRFGLESTVRPSFALYNTRADIDQLAGVLRDLSTRSISLR